MNSVLAQWRELWASQPRSGLMYQSLGLSRAAWSEFVSGKRRLPLYVERSIEAHVLLAREMPSVFQSMIRARQRAEQLDREEKNAVVRE